MRKLCPESEGLNHIRKRNTRYRTQVVIAKFTGIIPMHPVWLLQQSRQPQRYGIRATATVHLVLKRYVKQIIYLTGSKRVKA